MKEFDSLSSAASLSMAVSRRWIDDEEDRADAMLHNQCGVQSDKMLNAAFLQDFHRLGGCERFVI
jgi:hypothetical protein